MTAAVLLLALAPTSATNSDADLLTAAEKAFVEGTELRSDSAQARPAFARAAAGYDELWGRGYHNPTMTLNRANAHRLAGGLPNAVLALNEGLAIEPWNRTLQVALEDARSAVSYPVAGDLATRCRPMPPAMIGTRMSPTEAWSIAGLLWLLACGGLARFVMTRARVWLLFAGIWFIGLAILGSLWLQDHRHRVHANEAPLVVVAEDVLLRKGNSDSYPARLEPKLPRGVEVRELNRRGGWVQVRLAGGAVGWLPGSSVVHAMGE